MIGVEHETVLNYLCWTSLFAALLSSAYVARLKADSPPITYVTLYNTNTSHALNHPTGIMYQDDAVAGVEHLFVADTGNNRIVDVAYGSIQVVAGDGTPGLANGPVLSSQFNRPTRISGSGWITQRIPPYVPSGENKIIGHYLRLNIFDSQNNAIRLICYGDLGPACSDGSKNDVSTLAGGGPPGFSDGAGSSAQMNYAAHGASGYTGSPQNQLFVDSANNSIRMIQTNSGAVNGTVSSFSSNSAAGYADGSLSNARFNSPMSITTDRNGSYWVMDTGNFRIRKIDPSNNVTTYAGNGIQGYVDGPAYLAEFGSPMGSAYNPVDGSVYLADMVNNSIRRIDSTGNVSTVAGSRTAGSNDGTLAQAHFTHPTGVTMDLDHGAKPILYVTDTMNNSIRMINLNTGTVATVAK